MTDLDGTPRESPRGVSVGSHMSAH